MTIQCNTSQLLCILVALSFGLAGCNSTSKKPAERVRSDTTEARAVDDFESGAKTPPKTGTLFSLARILMSQGRDAEAMTVLNNLTQRYPDFMPAYNAKAECLLRAERTQEAIDALTAGLKRRPKDAVLLNNLGMIWFLEGRYEEALARFDAAAEVEPNEAMYIANQAMTLAMLGREKQAAAMYDRITTYTGKRHNLRILAKAREHASAEGVDGAADQPSIGGVAAPGVQ